ncbi:MAG: right-handed parallel beta-helix repeat-containing protein, partial [Thermoplasmata archaeon]|nr:right-handed parallel beta-helix repeat-containing protein [Thermoplasmata archaeon]
MTKSKLIGRILIVLSLLLVNFFPILGTPIVAESGAPDISGVTSATWYVNTTDDVTYNNREFWTRDIQINNSGKMAWNNVLAYIDGNITVQSDGFFNLTDCFLNLSGNFSIEGIVNFDNVTLIMNCTYDNEHWLNVAKTGTFNVLNNSNITAYDKTTPHDLTKAFPGNETWGSHYNFTVYGNLAMNNSFVSYTYGNTNYLGGIHLFADSKGIITNSTIFENELSGITCVGNGSHIIRDNHIYNATGWGIAIIDHAYARVENNLIETFSSNLGTGIGIGGWCDPLIIGNTIQDNRFDGIYLVRFSNATIQENTIINNERDGINITATAIVSGTGTLLDRSWCYPKIINNIIKNNYEFGIRDTGCPAEIINNTITNTKNQTGLVVQGWLPVQVGAVTYLVFYECFGNITN